MSRGEPRVRLVARYNVFFGIVDEIILSYIASGAAVLKEEGPKFIGLPRREDEYCLSCIL